MDKFFCQTALTAMFRIILFKCCHLKWPRRLDMSRHLRHKLHNLLTFVRIALEIYSYFEAPGDWFINGSAQPGAYLLIKYRVQNICRRFFLFCVIVLIYIITSTFRYLLLKCENDIGPMIRALIPLKSGEKGNSCICLVIPARVFRVFKPSTTEPWLCHNCAKLYVFSSGSY